MKRIFGYFKNTAISVLILAACFGACLVLQESFGTSTLISGIFVLGVFLISVITPGYVYGVLSAFVSVLAVDYAFAFPYFKIDLSTPENLISAIILFVVTLITCGLTAQVKRQETIKAESELERNRANLLRAVSHDLRTPLTTIYGASSAILENYDQLSREQMEKMLAGIGEDSRWLIRMVENLLSITKLDGENVQIIKSETVLDELIDSVLVKFAKRYPQTTVQVEIPEEFICVKMDAMLIEQVLLNLLENAAQHAKGMTELTLRVKKRAPKAVFEVFDNGCGIAEERLKHIFSGAIGAGSVAADHQKRNAGIGLSVCASIIKAHGGEISAENRKNGGCLFRFWLVMEDENE